MNDIRESLPFLKMPGLFFAANRQIPDLPMDDLNEMFYMRMNYVWIVCVLAAILKQHHDFNRIRTIL